MNMICTAFWHNDQVTVHLKNSAGDIVGTGDGIPTGSDSCTHKAEISAEMTLTDVPGMEEVYECDIQIEGEINTINTTVKTCAGNSVLFVGFIHRNVSLNVK